MSRVSVQVVLRDRMSISPDCSAVNRCLRAQRHEPHLVGVAEHRGGDGAADVDVEPGPAALVVRRAEAVEAGVDAADHLAAALHRVQRRPGLRRGRGNRRPPRRARPRRRTAYSFADILRLPDTATARPAVYSARRDDPVASSVAAIVSQLSSAEQQIYQPRSGQPPGGIVAGRSRNAPRRGQEMRKERAIARSTGGFSPSPSPGAGRRRRRRGLRAVETEWRRQLIVLRA